MNSDQAIDWLYQANRYFKASEFLYDAQNDEDFLYPYLTLLSFSIECSLKCIAHRTVKNTNGKHNSVNLFNNLPIEIQKNIDEEYKIYSGGKNIIDDFELIKNYFVASRYEIVGMIADKKSETLFSGTCFSLSEFLIEYISNSEDYINQYIQDSIQS